jgi:hypothetical protein
VAVVELVMTGAGCAGELPLAWKHAIAAVISSAPAPAGIAVVLIEPAED